MKWTKLLLVGILLTMFLITIIPYDVQGCSSQLTSLEGDGGDPTPLPEPPPPPD